MSKIIISNENKLKVKTVQIKKKWCAWVFHFNPKTPWLFWKLRSNDVGVQNVSRFQIKIMAIVWFRIVRQNNGPHHENLFTNLYVNYTGCVSIKWALYKTCYYATENQVLINYLWFTKKSISTVRFLRCYHHHSCVMIIRTLN